VDTWLKLRPVQGSSLQENERTFLKARLAVPLAAYRLVGDHFLITLGKDDRGNQLFMGGRNTWYAYAPSMEILRDGQQVDLTAPVSPVPVSPVPVSPVPVSPTPVILSPIQPAPIQPAPPTPPIQEKVVPVTGYVLRIQSDTFLKTSIAQGSSLSESDRAIVKAGREFPLAAYQLEGNHLKVTLGQTAQGQVFVQGRNTWYVYQPAAVILKDGNPLNLKPSSGGGSTSVAPAPLKPENLIPQVGIDLIKEFEGYAERLPDDRARAYADPIHGWNVPTIGYGTIQYPNGNSVAQGDIITRKQAEAYLIAHVQESTRPFLERIPTWSRMNTNQKGAIYSFAYNLGARFYGSSGFASITRVCDTPDRWDDFVWIREQFVKYTNPGTSAEVGLRRRREAEALLFVRK
jgi:GH24 family phage-related lysozyme (muramidase)